MQPSPPVSDDRVLVEVPANGAGDPLSGARAQLQLCARDLRKLLDEQIVKSRQVEHSNRQLLLYARALKKTLESERAKSQELEHAYIDTAHRLNRVVRYKDDET